MEAKKEALEAEYGNTFEVQRRDVNTARQRARDAESECAKSIRKLQRMEKRMEKADDDDNSDMDMDLEEDEDELNEITRRLPFELLPRRDEAGRFQAEAPEVRAVRWAQLARGVAQSTVSHNIADIIALLIPGLQLPAVDESTSKRMRAEVTLAGEAMAAWKFAASHASACSRSAGMRARSSATASSRATLRSSTRMGRSRTFACAG
jgi:hypothetical protein